LFACQTLDGAYWHFYDGNNNGISDASLKRAKTVVNLVKTTNPNRPYGSLNVQNTVRGYPATNCAMSGREGNGEALVVVFNLYLFIYLFIYLLIYF